MYYEGVESDSLCTITAVMLCMAKVLKEVQNGLTYVSLQLHVQNVVSAQPCVGKLGISLVLLNFLHCNFRLWFETT